MSSVQYLIGKTLGKYEVLEHVGHGGMSEVYRGQQAQLDRMVAIKVLHPFLADEGGFVVRFQREARIVATLRHPNIVQVYDFDHNDELDIYYMVMEFIDGPTLKDRLEEGSLMPQETARIGAAVADALDYAHQRSMVHRDIKPANIMFLDGHQPVLTDFGIAKMLTLSGLTASGAMVGTPAYMAPEIGIGEAGTALSDIYSLSVVLYQTATGILPFTAETPMGMVMQHINKEPPNPSLYNRNLPVALEQVILRGLRKKPEERYRDAAEMAAALREAIGVPTDGGLVEISPASPPPTESHDASGQAPVPSSESDDAVAAQRAAEEEAIAHRDAAQNDPPALTGTARVERGNAPAAKLWSPWSHRAIDEAPEPAVGTSEDGVGARRRAQARPRQALRGMLMLFLVTVIGGGLWYSLGGISPGRRNMLPARSSAARDLTETTPAEPTPAPLETITAAVPEPVVTQAPSPAADATVRADDCVLRVHLEDIDIYPQAVANPGTSVVAYITIRNSGTCTWPQAVRMIFAEGDLLDAPESFPVAALAPGEKIQLIVPMTAPEELGIHQTVWELRKDDGNALGGGSSGRITVDLTVENTPAAVVASAAPFIFQEETRAALSVTAPTLRAWKTFPSRDLWTGVAVVTGTGGSGTYTYYQDRISAETELPDGTLSFEWRRCEPYSLEVWVLSGAEILNWQGSIPYPDPDNCR